jgi:hypothetical protein
MRRALLVSSLLAVAACMTTSGPGRVATADPNQSAVPTSHPFEMKGTVQSVGGGLLGVGSSVTIARDGAPATQLHVADKTQIMLDDRPVKLSDLRQGDDVRAVFDFDKDTPVAIQIVAKPGRR